MNAKTKTLMLRGVKTVGGYIGALETFEEDLTLREYDEVAGFLAWVGKAPNARAFGWGNLDARLREFKGAA